MSTHVDDVAEAFRAAYAATVERVDLPGDQLPLAGVATADARRLPGWLIAATTALLLVVAIGAVAFLLRGEDGATGSAPVVRVALIGSPGVLGGEAIVVNSSPPEEFNFDEIAGVEMWQWAATGDSGGSVVVLEATPGDDLSAWLGTDESGAVLTAPPAGRVAAFDLPDTGWAARSWMAGERWRIAVGFEEAAVARVSDLLVSGSPIGADLPGFDLVYQGPQWIYPVRTEAAQLFYASPAGDFSVGIIRGWPHGLDAMRLEVRDAAEVDVNGSTGLVWEQEPNWWIAWPVDDQSIAMMDSSTLSPEALTTVARSVRPVTVAEWNDLAASAPEP
jgi:hypothetical protein